MTQNFFIVIRNMLGLCWSFFCLKIPGLNFTFGALLCACILIPLAFNFISSIFGNGGVSQINSTAQSYRNYKE